jgi:hypothetical protein
VASINPNTNLPAGDFPNPRATIVTARFMLPISGTTGKKLQAENDS